MESESVKLDQETNDLTKILVIGKMQEGKSSLIKNLA